MPDLVDYLRDKLEYADNPWPLRIRTNPTYPDDTIVVIGRGRYRDESFEDWARAACVVLRP